MEAEWMSFALGQAAEALSAKEVPVGCVFIHEGQQQKPVGWGRNCTNESKNATRHAELVAIDQVINWCSREGIDPKLVFPNCCLYVTVEPCVMCAAALQQLGVKKIVFGCRNERFGGIRSVINVLAESPHIEVVEGMMKEEAVDLLKRFYAEGNPNTTAT